MKKILLGFLALIAITVSALPVEARGPYGYGYRGGCGNCWVGPAILGGSVIVAASILSQPRYVPVVPVQPVVGYIPYEYQRTPVPGYGVVERPAPLAPAGAAYLDERLNRVCRDYTTEGVRPDGFHFVYTRKFCEAGDRRLVEVRRDQNREYNGMPVELNSR